MPFFSTETVRTVVQVRIMHRTNELGGTGLRFYQSPFLTLLRSSTHISCSSCPRATLLVLVLLVLVLVLVLLRHRLHPRAACYKKLTSMNKKYYQKNRQ